MSNNEKIKGIISEIGEMASHGEGDHMAAPGCCADILEALSELKAILTHQVEQEPVGTVRSGEGLDSYGNHHISLICKSPLPVGSHVYTRPQPAVIPEPTIDDAIAVQNAIGDGSYGHDDIELELEALRAYHIILNNKLSAAPSIAENLEDDQ
jgi:hypothetical protein